MIALDWLLLLALWSWGLWRRWMRSARTIAVLAIGTTAYAVGALVSPELGIPIRALSTFGVLSTLTFREDWLIDLDPSARQFNHAYASVLAGLRKAARDLRARRITNEQFLAELGHLIDTASSIDPPSARWQELRDRTVQHLQGQFVRYERLLQGEVLDEVEFEVADREVEELKRIHQSLLAGGRHSDP